MKKLLIALSVIFSAGLLGASWRHLIPMDLTEVFGFISGGYCVWLTVEENIWNWPIGIINNVFFLVLFLRARLYADSSLQGVYVVLGFLGWYWWLHGGARQKSLLVRRITPLEIGVVSVLILAATAGMTRFLFSIHDSAPFWDAFTTILSLAAQYLLTRKVLENWYVWMTADVIYFWLYLYKHLYLTSGLYGIFMLLCIQGLFAWQRSLETSIISEPREAYVD